MKVLSLFDGLSAGRLALERAGIEVEEYYASEIDKHASTISKKNWPDIIPIGDVTQVSYKDGVLHTPRRVDALRQERPVTQALYQGC